MLQGKWFDADTGDVAVIDQQTAQTLKVNVGDTIQLPSRERKYSLRVVGICLKPGFFVERTQWVYLPIRTCQQITGRTGNVTRVMIRLRAGGNAASGAGGVQDAFVGRWTRLLQEGPTRDLKVRLTRDTRKQLDQQLDGVHFMSYLGGAVSLLSAAFIIFSALSMGVAERQRTLAMLRAIGAWRGQVARLVVTEASYLGAAGAVIGVPLGLLWAWLLAQWHSDFFSEGVKIDGWGVLMGLAGALVAAIGAALMPALNASRTSPLEAMSPLARPASLRAAWICAGVGVVLLGLDSLVVYSPASREVKFYFHFLVGLPALMLGLFLLSPVLVWLVDRTLSRGVAALLGVRPQLVRQQLTGALWRAAGTGSALMIGLAILVVLQTMGNTMLSSWRLPTNFPDVFIYATGKRLPRAQWPQVANLPGVVPGRVMPMVVGAPGLPQGFMSILGSALLPDATMFVGVDPDLAMEMMELEFREGDKHTAAAALKKGGHIIITEEFRVLKGLKVGDTFPLMTRNGRKDFVICGVVWSPGIDVMVTMFDLQSVLEQQTVASVFGSLDDADKLFGWDQASLFAANVKSGVDKNDLITRMRAQIGERGWKVGDVRKIKEDVTKGFARILLLMTTIAMSAMGVAALGVTNTVMASVRSRLWQFGVLRSIGVTRGQLIRIVLAEALLLGGVGVVLGLVGGTIMTTNGLGMARYIVGYVPPLAPPWGMIALGIAVTLAVALVASYWPARSVANSQPLELLQAGRAAT